VTSFDVGQLDCAGGSEGSVAVSWATTDATAVEFAVDGKAPSGSAGGGPQGSATLQVPCDGQSHEVSVTAVNDAGAGETQTETVSGS
jgi:hypothetical protein